MDTLQTRKLSTGLTIGIERDFGHQATCLPKLLHVGRRMSSLGEDYQRSPQEHQAGFQDRQPGVV